MACMCLDPEAGMYRDESGGEYVYDDTGMTLEQQFPEQYCRVPRWSAVLVDFTVLIHGWAVDIAYERRAK